jgi:hypothetical protein
MPYCRLQEFTIMSQSQLRLHGACDTGQLKAYRELILPGYPVETVMSTCSPSHQRRNASSGANLYESGLLLWVHILTDMWSTLAHFNETSAESCLVPKLFYVPLPET